MIEIFSAIFRLEGVQIDKAKFQIISILTGTGFTTNESELMLASKRRRKITQIMILFSYIFNISIVSTIVNLFISTNDTSINEFLIGIILTIFNIILLIGLNKSTRIRRVFDNMILKIEKRKKRKKINQISIYDYYGNKVIAEVNITDLHDKIINLNIEKIKELYDIQILVIKRGSNIISEIDNNFKIQEKDILLVFGNYKNIKRLFRRNTKTYKSKTNKK
jgi:hypothetical protein